MGRAQNPVGTLPLFLAQLETLLISLISASSHLLRHTWLPECQFQDQSMTSEVPEYRIIPSGSSSLSLSLEFGP